MHPLISVVTLILNNDKKVLMVKRGNRPYINKWSLPGGHLEFGECLEVAARREVFEETGLDININQFIGFKNFIGTDSGVLHHFLIFCFKGEILGGILKEGDDAKEVDWKYPMDINVQEISPTIIDFLKTEIIYG